MTKIKGGSNQKKVQAERMMYAVGKLTDLGIITKIFDKTRIEFQYKGSKVMFYPYKGWASGKSIKDGRGIHNLLIQLRRGHS